MIERKKRILRGPRVVVEITEKSIETSLRNSLEYYLYLLYQGVNISIDEGNIIV